MDWDKDRDVGVDRLSVRDLVCYRLLIRYAASNKRTSTWTPALTASSAVLNKRAVICRPHIPHHSCDIPPLERP
jgi:hypothetical protein